VPISSLPGIWSSRSGKTGLSPSLLEVNSTARMSEVAVSMARWTLRPLSAMLASPCRAMIDGNLNTVLARLPRAISEELYPGTVHQQVKRAISTPIRDLDSQSFLPPTQGRIVGHGPVQVCQLQ
jgi:hypothetical protein